MSLVIKQTTPDAMSSLSGAHIKKFFYNIINNFLINQQWLWQATAIVPLLSFSLSLSLSVLRDSLFDSLACKVMSGSRNLWILKCKRNI